MDYSNCYLVDVDDWKSFMNQQEDHNEELEREAEQTVIWRENYKEQKVKEVALFQENKALKKQIDQQHKELQEIKDKLKVLLN